MEITILDGFKDTMLKHSQDLEDDGIEELFSLLQDDNDVGEFENQLDSSYGFEYPQRKTIYGDLIAEGYFPKSQKQLLMAWLYNSIMEKLSTTNAAKKIKDHQYSPDLSQGTQSAEETISTMIKSVIDLEQNSIRKIIDSFKNENSKNYRKIVSLGCPGSSIPQSSSHQSQNASFYTRKNDAKLFKQQLSQMESDIQKYYPASLERAIQQTICLIYGKAQSSSQESIRDAINTIESCYQNDKELFRKNPYKEEIEQNIKKMSSVQKDLDQLYSKLEELKRQVCIVDILSLERLLSKSKKSKDKIEGKNIILFMGMSGSGKSTTILRMLGNDFKQINVNGAIRYAPEGELSEEHASFHTSYEAVSCTSFINAASIPSAMKRKLDKKTQKIQIYVCDTPGFEDTRGCQIDIANQIGTINALYASNSIRLVFILPISNFTSKVSGVKDMTSIISRLSPDYDYIQSSMKIYINKTLDIPISSVKQSLRSLIKHKNQNQIGEKELDILNDLFEVIEDQETYINPVTEDIKLYEQRLKTIMKLDPINGQNIEQTFRQIFSEESKTQITSYLTVRAENIKMLVQKQKYHQAKYQYQNMHQFVQLFSSSEEGLSNSSEDIDQSQSMMTTNRYSNEVDYVNEFICKKIDKSFQQLEKYLEIILNNQSVEEYCKEASQIIKNIKDLSDYFGKRIEQSKGSPELDAVITDYGARLKTILSKDLQNVEGIVKKINHFAQYFNVPSLVNDIVEENQKKFAKILQTIDQEVQQETFSLEKSLVQQANNISIMLNTFKNGHASMTRFNTLRMATDSKFGKYLSTIGTLYKETSHNNIQKIRNELSKCQVLLNLELVSDMNQKMMGRDKVIKQIKQSCRQKMKTIINYSRGRNDQDPFDQKTTDRIKKLIKNISDLLKLDFVRDQCQKQYAQILEEMQMQFNESVKELRNEIQDNQHLQHAPIGQYEKYFETIQKTIKNIIRYSRVLNNEKSSTDQIEQLSASIRSVFSAELEQINSININDMNAHHLRDKIIIIFRKIKSKKKIVLVFSDSSSLVKTYDENKNAIDLKLSHPLEEFLAKAKEKMQPNSKGFSFFKNNLDILENLMNFIESIKQQASALGCTTFHQYERKLEKFIYEELIEILEQNISIFLDASSITIPEGFLTLVQVLVSIRSKPALLIYLSFQHYDPEQKKDDLKNRLEEINTEIEQKIEEETVDLFAQSSLVKVLKAIEKVIGNDKNFEDLQKKIKGISNGRSKDTDTTIKQIIENENDTSIMFDDLQPIIDSFKNDQKNENKDRLNFIFAELEKWAIKKVSEIRKYQLAHQNIFQRSQQDHQSQSVQADIQHCKAVFIFYQEIARIDLKDNKYWKRCTEKINSNFISQRATQLRKILESESRILLHHFNNLDLKKIRISGPIVEELQNCFTLLQTESQQQAKYVEAMKQCKQSLLKIASQKKLLKQGQKEDERTKFLQRSIAKMIHIIFTKMNDSIKQKYFETNEIEVDSQLATYYESCQTKVKEEFRIRISEQFTYKLEEYKNSQGSYDDVKSEAIKKEIGLLPLAQRKEFKKAFEEDKKKFQNKLEHQEKNFYDRIKSDSTNVKVYLKKITKISSNSMKYYQYCQTLEAILRQRIQQSKTIEEICVIVTDFYQKPAQEGISLENHEKIYTFYHGFYKTLLKNIAKLFQNSFKLLKREVIDQKITEMGESTKRAIVTAFKVFSELSRKKGLLCQQPTMEQEMLKQWRISFKSLINELKQMIEEQNPDIIIKQTEPKLKKYFAHLQFNSEILEIIQSQLKQMPQEYLDQQMSKAIVNIESIATREERAESYSQKINQMVKQLESFELMNVNSRVQTVQQIVESFQQNNKVVKFIQSKGQIIEQYILKKTPGTATSTSLNNFKELIEGKFDKLVQKTEEQLDDSFTHPAKQPSERLNCLLKIIKALQRVPLILISSQKLLTTQERVENTIKSQFTKLFQNIKMTAKQIDDQLILLEKNKKSLHCQQESKKKQLQEMEKKQCKIIEEQGDSQLEMLLKSCDQSNKEKIKSDLNAKVHTSLTSLKFITREKLIQLKTKYKELIEEESKNQNSSCKQLSLLLVLAQKNMVEITQIGSSYKHQFKAILNQFQDKDDIFTMSLTNSLMTFNDRYAYASQILHQQTVFESVKDLERIALTKDADIDYVLANTLRLNQDIQERKLNSNSITEIKKKFNQLSEQFESQVRKYEVAPDANQTLKNLREQIISESQHLKVTSYFCKGKAATGDKHLLLAKILALIAILRADAKSSSSKKNNKYRVTFRPHEIQVVTILLLLGIVNNKDQTLASRMAEVGTGEGKSIILAALSAYLALVGFNVRCSCYSQYLSKRDEENFSNFFEYLDIADKIKYQTFNTICEQILNSGEQSFQGQVKKMIFKEETGFLNTLTSIFGHNSVSTKRQDKNNKSKNTILLIDEVDVFFEDEFYGQCYRPSLKLKDQSINKLFELIWSHANNKTIKRNSIVELIRKSKQFANVLEKYRKIEAILENQLNSMVQGAFSYKHDYFIMHKQKRLVYRQNDSINYKLSYGYKTVFANIYEHEKGNVSLLNLREALSIELVIAEFSYATLPQFFKNIIGVTGTLRAMPMVKKKTLRDGYTIKDNYIIPSSYGSQELRVYKYFQVEENDHFMKIKERIDSVDKQRPIIVFFESATQLYDFYNSSVYPENLKERTLILTEEHDPCTRQRNVNLATHASTISLMTKSFGRGTDFCVYNKIIQQNGGLHVTQAFLSHQKAEEVQIKGRTNRQNQSGSVDIIFKTNQLADLQITHDLKNATLQKINDSLQSARQAKATRIFDDRLCLMNSTREKHERNIKIYEKNDLKQKELLNFLLEINKCPNVGLAVVKTVLALDATGSMGGVLGKVIEILKEMFTRTYQVIEEKRVNLNVEISIIIYRNYNSSSAQILQSTPFESGCDNLFKFLSKLTARGGYGNQAIQVCLGAVNKLDDVSQVVLIGDAPENTESQIIYKRADRGQTYWQEKNFPKTNVSEQLSIIKDKKYPIHTFYIGSSPKKSFRRISAQTDGQCSEFPCNNSSAAIELSDFIVKKILMIGQTKLEAQGVKNTGLLLEYQKRYS